MSIAKSCLIINIQVHVWMGYRLDKTTTLRVTQEAEAHPDAARVSKHLVPKATLADIVNAASAVRNDFYSKTLPWKDNGDRLLTRKLYMEFARDHGKLRDGFNAAVQDFLDNKYPAAREQASFRMGELFNEADYPSVNELRNKFYVNCDVDGVPAAYDLRLNNNEEVIQGRITKAMQGLWEKLAVPLRRFHERMADEDCKFHATTVTNLRDIVEMIPALNFTNDPALEQIRLDIEKQLTIFDPEDLRKDKLVRAGVAEEARQIMETMEGFMNAFGHHQPERALEDA